MDCTWGDGGEQEEQLALCDSDRQATIRETSLSYVRRVCAYATSGAHVYVLHAWEWENLYHNED